MGNTSNLRKKGRGNHGIILSSQDLEFLTKALSNFSTKTEAAISIGLDRNVLDRVILTRRGSIKTVNKIQNYIYGRITDCSASR